MYNNITHQIRGTLAINFATETVLVNEYHLSPHMAKKVVTALNKCGGLKDSDLNSNAKIKKKLGRGIGDKTVQALSDRSEKAFKCVFFLTVKLDKAEHRIPGFYETEEAVQKAYAKETSTKEKTRKISKMTAPSKKVIPAKRGKKDLKVYVSPRRLDTHEKVTMAQVCLELRLEQLERKELKEVPPCWTISPRVPFAPKPVKVKGKIGIPAPTKEYYAGLSSCPSNTGVIGLADMLLAFGPEVFSPGNRAYSYKRNEPMELPNGKTAIREVIHHGADWGHLHALHENGRHALAADLVATRSPEDIAEKAIDGVLCGVDDSFEEKLNAVLHGKLREEDLIPLGRIPKGALRMLRQTQVDDPKARKEMLAKAGIKDPKPNEHLKYDGLLQELSKLASLSGVKVDYGEAEEGFSVDQESINYHESYVANRRDNSAEQESHDAVHGVSKGSMYDKLSFFLACRDAYESKEYQIFLKFKEICGGIDRSAEIKAVEAKISKIYSLLMEATDEEAKELNKQRKQLNKDLKGIREGNVNAEGAFNELLETDSNGAILSYKDAKKLYNSMKRKTFGKRWLAEKWLEILDGQEGKSREEAEQDIDSWGMAVFQMDTDETYLSAEIGGDGNLYDVLGSDEKREEASADEMMKHQKKQDFFAHVAVVYQQAMGFVQKKIIQNNYEEMLNHGVPARKTMVRGVEFMTEAIEPVKDFHERQEKLCDLWEDLSEAVPTKKLKAKQE